MIARYLVLPLLSLGINLAFAQDSQKPSCAVIGFVNQVENREWHDGRVGMGVRAMLSQSLSATGLFSLFEEKEEIRGLLEEASRVAWTNEKTGLASIDSAVKKMQRNGAAFVAFGRVFYYGKPRTKASVGPAHFESDEVEIKIEVTLKNTANGKIITAVGNGKAATTAASGIFTFHGENLDADASMVGTATRKAIDAAIKEIAKKYRKVYKIK